MEANNHQHKHAVVRVLLSSYGTDIRREVNMEEKYYYTVVLL